jgi:ribosomal protein L11 methyltransferase
MARSDLIQISLSLPPDAEDAIEHLFEKFFQQVPSIYTDADTGKSKASVFVAKPLTAAVQKQFAAEFEALRCTFSGLSSLKEERIRRENWAESWKKHFKPIQIGSKLLIKPSWSKLKPRKNQAVVTLDPGLSFGTGQHATTSFCLRRIVAARTIEREQSFLDIGTGSGILSIAAAKLGYSPVEAFDFDPESIRVSIENTRQNDVAAVFTPKQQDLTKLPLKSKKQYDVICANLIYDLLIAEAIRITNRLKPSGDLILAGILATQFRKVSATYEKLGFLLVTTQKEKEWQSGHFRRADITQKDRS